MNKTILDDIQTLCRERDLLHRPAYINRDLKALITYATETANAIDAAVDAAYKEGISWRTLTKKLSYTYDDLRDNMGYYLRPEIRATIHAYECFTASAKRLGHQPPPSFTAQLAKIYRLGIKKGVLP